MLFDFVDGLVIFLMPKSHFEIFGFLLLSVRTPPLPTTERFKVAMMISYDKLQTCVKQCERRKNKYLKQVKPTPFHNGTNQKSR